MGVCKVLELDCHGQIGALLIALNNNGNFGPAAIRIYIDIRTGICATNVVGNLLDQVLQALTVPVFRHYRDCNVLFWGRV